MRAVSPRPAGRPRRIGAAAAVLAALGLSGLACGGTSPGVVSWVEEGARADGARVVMAPLNLAVHLDPDLEEAVEPVGGEMIRYFQASGARVAIIWPSDAWSLWRDSMAAVERAEGLRLDLDTTARVFVQEVGRQAEFDLLVMPSLIFREARVAGRYASWDGVRRKIDVYTRGGPEPGLPPAEWRSEWGGRISALSLHVLGFTPQGRRVYQGWGGLDVVHEAVVKSGDGSRRSFLRLQRQLLENPEHVREGVQLALAGYALRGAR